MRVTTTQIYDNLLTGVNKQLQIQAKGNEQISSGTRFQRPSEAGLDYKVSLDLRHAKIGVQGSLEAIGISESRLSASQTMLNDMGNILVRAQTIAVQQGSAQVGATERQAAAQEVAHLLDQFANNANAQWQGQSLFAGTAVDKPAFTLTPVADTTTGAFAAGNGAVTAAVVSNFQATAVGASYSIASDGAGLITVTSSVPGVTGTGAFGGGAITLSDGTIVTPTYGVDAAGTAATIGATSGGGSAYTYTGNQQDRLVAVADGQSLSSNIRGDNPAFSAAFSALKGFETALLNNDVAGINTALGNLTSAGSAAINLTSEVGGRLSAISVMRTSYENMQFTLDQSINSHEAVDVPAVVAQLQQSSIALQASYSQISNIKNLSLMNFLQ